MHLLGQHHVSIMTGKAEKNFEFFTKVLGMRLVKKSVNQDNTTSYHLFYGDAVASPGTEVTYFDYPGIGPSYHGISSISATSLRVPTTASLEFWASRLDFFGVKREEIEGRAGRDTLAFEDFEGTRLILAADNDESGVAPGTPWAADGIPLEHAVVGLGPVTLTVGDPKPTALALTQLLGFRKVGSYPSLAGDFAEIEVFATGEGGSGAEVHVEARPDLPRARLGRGGVHHVAFRIPNEEEYAKWIDRIAASGLPNSGRVDRDYFRALYFREPNGILFELSTDTPGFDIDEPVESLGEKLGLPSFLEHRRAEIEANLRPLDL
ncbi:ring-cleaving dioxygenase [Saccharibacillus sp. CPCC 101409]|uniref:ring-cleaving dioxygenase n=1 Tax=Saccharibacillus sp. CPCC 101409 TaxID=3058041 RepID=UPI0026725CE5|nr:ring-cleaving dioxygenase [Saccharibacillus sp. CPCC 101409]MDO3409369.1 ring-cleaving dioxygenase [Saccharibacillus sp. CPCC 101409]